MRIARIAQDAGVSTSLVHYHFATREALLAEAVEHSFEQVADARIVETIERGDVPAAERLAEMVDQSLPLPGKLERDWVLWIELWRATVRNPELRAAANDLYARYEAWFAGAIRAGVRSGEFRECDAHAVAARAIALIDGYSLRVLMGDAGFTLERARREVGDRLAADLGLGEQLPYGKL